MSFPTLDAVGQGEGDLEEMRRVWLRQVLGAWLTPARWGEERRV